MTTPLELSIVRIYSNTDKVIGAGFLVDHNHILTCSHVVVSALGIKSVTSEIPVAEVTLDFPKLAPGNKFTAKVVFWLPPNPNASNLEEFFEDIAVLELGISAPNTVRPVRLITSDKLWGHPFRVFGFPKDKQNGAWASGELRAELASRWVQLEATKQTGYRLEEGFSGAPIWDEELQGVVGMAVASEKQRLEVKAAFIIPTTQLVKAFSQLNQQVIRPDIWRSSNTPAKDTVEPGTRTQNLRELPTTNYNYSFIVDRVNWKELIDGSRVYSFDVFNRNHADGVLEIRSQNGELIHIQGINSTRIPPNVFGFGLISIERLWRLATEGYDFLDDRNSLGNAQKTEIRNIIVPPGGTVKLTKIGEYALIYNQATFLAESFFESLNNPVLLALCEQLQKKNIGSFVKSESLRNLMTANLNVSLNNFGEAFLSSSWIDNQKLAEMKKVCEEVMRRENIRPNKNILGIFLNFPGLEILRLPITGTEDFMKHGNKVLQWLAYERAQIVEEEQGALFIAPLP